MSNRQITTKTIHPDSIKELGLEEYIVALGVAHDLRSGKIPPEDYDQGQLYPFAALGYCGTPCCIAGHIALRMKADPLRIFSRVCDYLGGDLFRSSEISDPLWAADAIERYVYDGNKRPWLHRLTK